MDESGTNDEPSEPSGIEEPQGKWLGVPYDWRRPTKARFKARWWNPDDHRVFTPRAFGWGYDVNLHRLLHRSAHRS
jgi:Family of unknown function (DUF5808)